MKTTRGTMLFAVYCFTVLTLGCAPQKPSIAPDPAAADETAVNLIPHQKLARDIYQQLIEIDTTLSGSTTVAAEAIAERLRDAGFPADDIQVLGPKPRKGNLVARFRGTGVRKPIILLAHLDVVEAKREDWSVDPFRLLERDGYFYGRGTVDDKAMAAIWVASVIRYKQEGFRSDRDLILCLTADEEGGEDNGVEWLLGQHRNLIDAEYALNEGGSGQLKGGKRLLNQVQASEKIYVSFALEVKNKGGHSSLPIKDNAIYRLSEGLIRLSKFDFPVKLNEVTRTFFERMSQIESGQVAADMKDVSQSRPPDPSVVSRLAESAYYNAQMRTTCIATQLTAGHAENALPQSARAVVNCRLLPGESADELQQTLVKVLNDNQIVLSLVWPPDPSPPSPLSREVLEPIERITAELWPGIPVVPTMLTGATDGLYLRKAGIPTYGVSGLFDDIDDIREHGRDERLGVKEFFEGQEFLYRLVKALASGAS